MCFYCLGRPHAFAKPRNTNPRKAGYECTSRLLSDKVDYRCIIVNPPFNQEGRTIHFVQAVGVWMYQLSVWANRSRLKAQLFPSGKEVVLSAS
jgi:hypothetical protein